MEERECKCGYKESAEGKRFIPLSFGVGEEERKEIHAYVCLVCNLVQLP
jgi:hypothetical protein